MKLTVNGESREIDGAATVAALLALFGLNARMVVIEHNGEIIPRGTYADAELNEGDNLEIVQMMAGG